MVLNTPSGGEARGDGYEIRAAATSVGTPCITTVAEFGAAIQAIEAMRHYEWAVTSLQEHAAKLKAAPCACQMPDGTAGRPAAPSLRAAAGPRPWRPAGRCAWGSTRTRRCSQPGA